MRTSTTNHTLHYRNPYSPNSYNNNPTTTPKNPTAMPLPQTLKSTALEPPTNPGVEPPELDPVATANVEVCPLTTAALPPATILIVVPSTTTALPPGVRVCPPTSNAPLGPAVIVVPPTVIIGALVIGVETLLPPLFKPGGLRGVV